MSPLLHPSTRQPSAEHGTAGGADGWNGNKRQPRRRTAGQLIRRESHRSIQHWAISSVFAPVQDPHLNGKVERSQQIDWIEFYATAGLQNTELEDRFGEWQLFYNWQRPHSSLGGKTPTDRSCELHEHTTLRCVICEADKLAPLEEHRERDFQLDLGAPGLKRSL